LLIVCYNINVRNGGRKMDIFTLVMLALSGGFLGAMVGMALAIDYEYNKKYVKVVLVYLVCIIAFSLAFVLPPLILCM
jgi:uncharacterized membrane protein YsdA (DUF1294 family)